MKSKWIVPLLSVAGLLVAMVAFAADAAKRTPAPDARDVRKEVVRIVEPGGGEGASEMEWEGEDDFGAFAFGDDGPGGDGDRRMVIRRRTGPGGMGAHRGMGMGRGMGMHRGMGMGLGFAGLDLTDAQRGKFAAIHERQQRRTIQAQADLKLARLDLRKLMKADAPSATAINAQIDRLARMRADLQKSHVATRLEARALLTPEQLKQLREAKPGPLGRRMRTQRYSESGTSKSD